MKVSFSMPYRGFTYRILLLLAVLVQLSSLSLTFFVAASAIGDAGRELADLLESEATEARTAHPPYALFHAFGQATDQKVLRKALLENIKVDPITKKSYLEDRADGLMERERTVVSKGAGASVDVCFHFHRRYFFRPERGGANASATQLWPYFYQYQDFLQAVPEHTVTQTHRGVLDIDAAAFAVLEEMRAGREIELVLLAYNDWDTHADEALAAVANFTERHGGAMYSPDGLAAVTSRRVRRCGQTENTNGAPLPKEVVAIARDGLDWVGTSAAPQATFAEAAAYATLNLKTTVAEAEGALQLVGAARMAAFSGTHAAAAEAFTELQRSASPRLFFITSESMGHLDLSLSATASSPPSVLAQHGFSSFDVHRFVHQHSRSSFHLANKTAYQLALQLHRRVLVLVGHPAKLPDGWWTALGGPPHMSTAVVRALRRHIPFFLSQSTDAMTNTSPPAAAAAADLQDRKRRCVLPTRRIDVLHEARARYGAATAAEQLKTLRWDSTVLQLRLVQQQQRSDASTPHNGDVDDSGCQWVQHVELPYPTAATDRTFYDTVVFSAVTAWVQRVQIGDEDWVARLGTTAQFSRQLDALLQPAVSHPRGQPSPALVLAVESAASTGVDCASALQKLQQQGQSIHNASDAGAAAATYATLSARLSTVEAELRRAAHTVPVTALPTLLSHIPSLSAAVSTVAAAAQWTTLAGRCPLFLILRDTEDIFHVTGTAAAAAAAAGIMERDLVSYPPTASAASLEVVDDGALAVALLDVHRQLSADATTAEGEGETAATQKETHSPLYASAQTQQRWRVVLPADMEVPVVVYEMTAAAQTLLTTSLPATAPTFVLLTQSECGVCANYAKAFELLRRTYRRTSLGADTPQQPEAEGTHVDHGAAVGNKSARFILVDLALGSAASQVAGLKQLPSDESRAHWKRAMDLLLPFYVTNVKALSVPQLLLVNSTHVVATLPTDAYAERWHWPHALLRLMGLSDAALDVEATKTAMWDALEAERKKRTVLRGTPP